jgi:molybdenum cofactor cytidylyltransferase
MKNFSVIVLAGGNSNRMKQSKAFLEFDYHVTFLEKIVNEYLKAGLEKIVLVINPYSLNTENIQKLSQLEKKITIIYNQNQKNGRLYSLKLGLSILNESENCFIQNIDNPFVSLNLIKAMIPLIKSETYISPIYKGKGGHPVLISNSISKYILEMKGCSFTLRDILEKFNKITTPSNESVIININTDKDYKKYFN